MAELGIDQRMMGVEELAQRLDSGKTDNRGRGLLAIRNHIDDTQAALVCEYGWLDAWRLVRAETVQDCVVRLTDNEPQTPLPTIILSLGLVNNMVRVEAVAVAAEV